MKTIVHGNQALFKDSSSLRLLCVAIKCVLSHCNFVIAYCSSGSGRINDLEGETSNSEP